MLQKYIVLKYRNASFIIIFYKSFETSTQVQHKVSASVVFVGYIFNGDSIDLCYYMFSSAIALDTSFHQHTFSFLKRTQIYYTFNRTS